MKYYFNEMVLDERDKWLALIANELAIQNKLKALELEWEYGDSPINSKVEGILKEVLR